MAQENPYAKYVTGGSAPTPPASIPGTPRPEKPSESKLPQGYERGPDGNARPIPGLPAEFVRPDSVRQLTPEEAAQKGLKPGGIYQVDSNGRISTVQAARDPKPMPQSSATELENGATGVINLNRLANTFRPEYAGNAITGGLENSIQSRFSSFGSEGQAQWWSDVKANDNVLRNALFGASLTAGEGQAWEATTINPSMAPDQVIANLKRRRELAIGILKRRRDFYIANGYSPEAVDALVGDSLKMLEASDAPVQKKNEDGGPPGLIPVDMFGDLPKGTKPVFAMDKIGTIEPFNRADFVRSNYKLEPQQEDYVIALWSKNVGNPNIDPEQVRAAYRQAGIPEDSPLYSDETIKMMIQRANAEETIKAGSFGPIDTSQAETEYVQKLDAMNKAGSGPIGAAARDPQSFSGYSNRLLNFAGMRDEVAGAGGFLYNLFTGENPTDGYIVSRDADRLMQQQQKEQQGVLGEVIEFTGDLPIALSMPGAASRTVGGAAKAGGSFGALSGFGQGEGAAGSTLNALIGGGVGAGTGAALQKGINFVAARRGAPKNALIPNADEVVAAGEREGVRVMTTDIRPPRTMPGKAARRTGEAMMFAGTSGPRAAQNAERQEAVTRLIDEFAGPEGPVALDAVAKDFAKTRGDRIARLTAQKDAVIDGVQGPMPPEALQNTVRAIDQQIEKLNGINSDAFAPVVSKLQGFREQLTSGKTLRQIEGNRRLLGDLFKDPNLASISGDGQKALNAIYGPLREDMANIIRTRGGPQAVIQWKNANDRLATMAGELNVSSFRRALKQVDSTPEEIGKILFSLKPSDIRRLAANLSEEGVGKVQSAIVYKAAEKATKDGVVSPKTFATALDAMDNATGIFFSKADKARLDGFTRLINATQHASEATASPLNGAANLGATTLLTIGQAFASWAIPAGITIGGLARAFESKVTRNLLMRLGKTKPGSEAEKRAANQIMGAIMRSNSGRPTAANDVIASRLGAAPAQSPASAAASEQEQN